MFSESSELLNKSRNVLRDVEFFVHLKEENSKRKISQMVMIYSTFSNKSTPGWYLEIIDIIGDRCRSSWGIDIIIKITTILAILLTLFDNISEIKESINQLPYSIEDICRFVSIIFRHFHSFQYHRYHDQEKNSQYNTYNHKSDTISSFLLVFFLTMSKHKKDDGAYKGIDTTKKYDDNDNSQNRQDDILKTCIGIDSVHENNATR